MKSFIFILLLLIFNTSFGDVCPTSPLKISPDLNSSVKYDNKKNFYTYAYEFKNNTDAHLPINRLLILVDEVPFDIQLPKGWGYTYNNQASDNFPKHLLLNTMSQSILPGKKIFFSFKSTKPPEKLKYYTRGETDFPTSFATDKNDEPVPNCPGFFLNGNFLGSLVNGITIGPSVSNQISVNLKLKKLKIKNGRMCPEDEADEFNEVSPYKDSGKVVAILKSNKDFDVTTIDTSTVRLGTGAASVLNSEITGAKKYEKLVLTFDLEKLGIECERDRVLFLTGKTIDGKDILGAAPIKAVGCDLIKNRSKKESHQNHH